MRETPPSPNSQRQPVTSPADLSLNWTWSLSVAADVQVKAATGGEPGGEVKVMGGGVGEAVTNVVSVVRTGEGVGVDVLGETEGDAVGLGVTVVRVVVGVSVIRSTRANVVVAVASVSMAWTVTV